MELTADDLGRFVAFMFCTVAIVIIVFIAIGMLPFFLRSIRRRRRPNLDKRETEMAPIAEAIREHFPAKLVKVTDTVYVAVGYALSNSILLIGNDCCLVVDGTGEARNARKIYDAFSTVVNFEEKPIAGIIYTHFHEDHTLGTEGFLEKCRGAVPIYAHQATKTKMTDGTLAVCAGATGRRSIMQFGFALPKEAQLPFQFDLRAALHDRDPNVRVHPPTSTFDGAKATLIHLGNAMSVDIIPCPGETPDQVVVWLPDQKVLIPSDNVYASFPNLYPIRGAPYRDVQTWWRSVHSLLAFEAEHLVPCHGMPIRGGERVSEVIRDYRDAIKFVHDQTVRLANAGLSPDEIAERVRLPPRLANSPFLVQLYGDVSSSVRSIYCGNLGWFDGNPTNLRRLSPALRGKKFVELIGNDPRKVIEAAEAAIGAEELQWALELVDLLIAADAEVARAKELKATALFKMGRRETNFPFRNYYLSSAYEILGRENMKVPADLAQRALENASPEAVLEQMAANLNPAASENYRAKAKFVFPGKESRVLEIDRGVAYCRADENQDCDVVARMTFETLIDVLLRGKFAFVKDAFTGKIQMIKGSLLQFKEFVSMFGK